MTLEHQDEIHSYRWALSNVPRVSEKLFLEVSFLPFKRQVVVSVIDKQGHTEYVDEHFWYGATTISDALDFRHKTRITDINGACRILVQKKEAYFR